MCAESSAPLRLAVVSPFLDRAHGTERALSEVITRLAQNYPCEIHLFAQQVTDLPFISAQENRSPDPRRIVWHRVAPFPGPLLLSFLVWFFRNRRLRRNVARESGAPFDVVLSPGINCSDADAIIVHALFHRLRILAQRNEDATSGALRKLHRKLYYQLLTFLERRIYRNPAVSLAAVSPRTKADLAKFFQRADVQIIPNAVDTKIFSPPARLARREAMRLRFQFEPQHFVLLLIGNDWAVKGLPVVLQAMSQLATANLRLLVVGSDAPAPFQKIAAALGILPQCRWEPPAADVMQFFSAADAYLSPSFEDSFGMPVAEAMACGLPAITSSQAGISAFVENNVDAFVLPDPQDAHELARLLAALSSDAALQQRIGAAAAKKSQNWTWENNAAQVWQLLNSARAKKNIAKQN